MRIGNFGVFIFHFIITRIVVSGIDGGDSDSDIWGKQTSSSPSPAQRNIYIYVYIGIHNLCSSFDVQCVCVMNGI